MTASLVIPSPTLTWDVLALACVGVLVLCYLLLCVRESRLPATFVANRRMPSALCGDSSAEDGFRQSSSVDRPPSGPTSSISCRSRSVWFSRSMADITHVIHRRGRTSSATVGSEMKASRCFVSGIRKFCSRCRMYWRSSIGRFLTRESPDRPPSPAWPAASPPSPTEGRGGQLPERQLGRERRWRSRMG